MRKEVKVPSKVLIVEDDPANMKLVLMSLRQHGYALVEAHDGQEAVDMAVKEKPDLILMDVRLPKLSGIEVTNRLRQMPAFHGVPIIGLTAHAMAGDREAALEAGFDEYLTKPFNTRELPGLIADALAKGRRKDK
jgi:CheY-like chemotaxis protein